YMALMLAGRKGINSETWSAAKLDGVPLWRVFLEIIIPIMKFTFITCAILLSLGIISAYDVVLAMANGGPWQRSWGQAYFTSHSVDLNRANASAATLMMLIITCVVVMPLFACTVWQQRGRADWQCGSYPIPNLRRGPEKRLSRERDISCAGSMALPRKRLPSWP